MTTCHFASDLHGSEARYLSLFAAIRRERPDAVFLGGDLLPFLGGMGGVTSRFPDFLFDFVEPELKRLRADLGEACPRVFAILGNDDPRVFEEDVEEIADQRLWQYVHRRRARLAGRPVLGYAMTPPSPLQLKDWERYDVSRYVDPGCVSPEGGYRSVPVPANETRYRTIREDLEGLAGEEDLSEAICLFHAPPYRTNLDRADLDGKSIDHVPLDVHIGSIAIRRFLLAKQPAVALCGHVHESARLTGEWRDRLGETRIFTGAHDGEELALVTFDPADPDSATRRLI